MSWGPAVGLGVGVQALGFFGRERSHFREEEETENPKDRSGVFRMENLRAWDQIKRKLVVSKR